jgi:hypothetical protein
MVVVDAVVVGLVLFDLDLERGIGGGFVGEVAVIDAVVLAEEVEEEFGFGVCAGDGTFGEAVVVAGRRVVGWREQPYRHWVFVPKDCYGRRGSPAALHTPTMP